MKIKSVLKICTVLVLALLLCAFVPENGLPKPQDARPAAAQAEEPSEEEILAYIEALPEINWEGDDNDTAYCYQDICYTWADVYAGNLSEEADEAMTQAIHCEAVRNSNSWSPLTGCPKPGWVK